MVGRPYDEARDLAAVTRVWREARWIDDSPEQADGVRRFLAFGATLVADVDGEAECVVHRTPGSMRYLATDLPLCAISAVLTSHVGRRQGLASVLTVEALTAAAEEGAAVASLGFFEQGYYDRFGFGARPYEHELRFDPAALSVAVPDRPPRRLGPQQMVDLHGLMVRRHRGHGSVVLDPPDWFGAEWTWRDGPVAFGWQADDGRLTHALFGAMKDEHGPFEVEVLAYEQPHQLLDLLGWLRALGDQVHQVVIRQEPAEVQLQDLIRHPLRQREVAALAGGSEALHRAVAEYQDRILDLPACVAAVRTPVPASFGLRLHDPLEATGGWPGAGGEWTIVLGADGSYAARGIDGGLPVVEATIGAFTRLWLGVRPASGLALTDRLEAPPALLARLDESLRLPRPQLGWGF